MSKQQKELRHIKTLAKKLKVNAEKLDRITELYEKEQIKNDPDALERLFSNEFSLCIENSGLYEDLELCLNRYEEEYKETNLELKRIRKEMEAYLRVKIVDL